MLDAEVCGEPPGDGRPDREVVTYLIGAYLELFALVDDGPAATAAGAIAWVLMLLIELRKR